MVRASPQGKGLFKMARARAATPKPSRLLTRAHLRSVCRSSIARSPTMRPQSSAQEIGPTTSSACNREDFRRLITLCWNYPDRISSTLKDCEKLADEESRDLDDDWEAPPSNIGNIERDFVVRRFSEQAPPLPADVLDEMSCRDGDFVYKLLSVATGLPLTTAIPVGIKEKKSLTGRFFNRRLREVGCMSTVLANIAGKKYDIKNGGPYKLTFTGERLAKVCHIGGGEAEVPAHIHISADFKVVNCWCDLTAAASCTHRKCSSRTCSPPRPAPTRTSRARPSSPSWPMM